MGCYMSVLNAGLYTLPVLCAPRFYGIDFDVT